MSLSHRRLAEHRRAMRRHQHHFSFADMVVVDPDTINEQAAEVATRLEFILATGANAENELEWFENNNYHHRRSSQQQHQQQRPNSNKLRYSYGHSFSDWVRREQMEYQRHLGATHWNLGRNSVYLHRYGPPQAELMLLKRVRACIGWAIHGLIFEFLDGTRVGYVSDVCSIDDNRGIERRRPTEWIDVEPGDYVRAVHGFNLSRSCFLCHSIHFEMASGRTISFESQHEPWKGSAFKYSLPENSLLQYVSCREGRCIGITGVETPMHLPVASAKRVQTLPEPCRESYQFFQLIAHRLDSNLEKEGSRPLGRDLWGKIIGEYLACYDLQDQTTSALGLLFKNQNQQQCKKMEEQTEPSSSSSSSTDGTPER